MLTGMGFASWAEFAFALAMLPPLVFFLFCGLYLWRFLLNALPARGRVASLLPYPKDAMPRGSSQKEGERARFVILIPAHNEALLIGDVLDALTALDYPRSAYRVVVIADNCVDKTAEIARAHGATALERSDSVRIGKGYALEWALPTLFEDTALAFDAVVILDADTFVASNLLTSFEAGLTAGHRAMQAVYGVQNPDESWRTRLMTCALALAHIVKPLGRERLRLSDGLKGNGMCFAREVVQAVPWSGESITEDIEYTLRLCRAGYRVAFLAETAVWAQMPTTGAQSASQRKRWEGGRYRLLVSVVPRLLAESLRARSRLLFDRAVELIIPPFAELFAAPVVLLCVCALAAWGWGWRWAAGLAWGWGFALALQIGYLAVGLWLARVPAATALSLFFAPAYIVWKLGIYLVMAVSRSAGGWKRTERRSL